MTKGLVTNMVVSRVINGNDRLRREIGIGEAEDLNIFCRCKMLEQCRDFTLAIDIEDITRWREDMNFMFECQEQYLTSERSERVRYCSCHSNIKFISSRHRVISSIYTLAQ